MEQAFAEQEKQRHRQKDIRKRWPAAFDGLPDWLFAPEPEPLPLPPTPEEFDNLANHTQGRVAKDGYKRELERIRELSAERKTFHDEMSKTIRRVFYTLVSASLFCVVAVTSTPDIEILTMTMETAVTLPMLNYAMGLEAFLLVGPIVLIALAVYLHIFVGQHRRLEIAQESSHPMLPNFNDRTPRLAVYLIFYWMVPVTLAVFAWKASPRPVGPYLGCLAVGVAFVMFMLQCRRCRREWRTWALLFPAAAFILFSLGTYVTTIHRKLDLSRVDLSWTDLRAVNLSGARLSGVNLCKADLFEADLSDAILFDANLSGAKLVFADLSGSKLLKANLIGAELGSADLSEADLSGADLSAANLLSAIVTQDALDQACGDETTSLSGNLEIKFCPKDQGGGLSQDRIECPPAKE